jgi:hypothetical protein
MTEDKWNDLPQVKMGDCGQALIFEFLLLRGLQCYKPDFPGSHVIDWMGFARRRFLGRIGPMGIEAKTKRHRDNWPDTGVDLHHFERYQLVAKTMPVLLCFCDTSQQYIYGNFLDVLEKPLTKVDGVRLVFDYPTDGGIRFWHLSSMVPFRKLTEAECSSIEKHETRAPIYRQKEPWFYPFSNPGLL